MILVLLLAATPAAATAKKPILNNAGEPFCSYSGGAVYQKADGTYYAIFSTSFVGDLAKAQYPGGVPLLNAGGPLKPYVVVSYRLNLNAQGAPTGLQANEIKASAGQMNGNLSREGLAMKVVAGQAATPAMAADPTAFIISNLTAKISAPEYGGTAPPVALSRMAAGVQRGPREIVVISNNREVARIVLEREGGDPAQQLTPIRATLAKLKLGDC